MLASTLLASCSYAPAAQTDTSSPKYQADYAACDATVPGAVDKRNAKTGLAWLSGPVTRWSRIDDGMNACMAAHGWGHARACTAEELSQGQSSSRVVTRTGVRCSDPNTPS